MASKKKAKAPRFDTSFNFGANVRPRKGSGSRNAAVSFYASRKRK